MQTYTRLEILAYDLLQKVFNVIFLIFPTRFDFNMLLYSRLISEPHHEAIVTANEAKTENAPFVFPPTAPSAGPSLASRGGGAIGARTASSLAFTRSLAVLAVTARFAHHHISCIVVVIFFDNRVVLYSKGSNIHHF